jgi:hypothetical protein
MGFVEIAKGLEDCRVEEIVWLEQSPGLWYKGFVYCGQFSYGSFVYLLLYMDDILIAVKSILRLRGRNLFWVMSLK